MKMTGKNSEECYSIYEERMHYSDDVMHVAMSSLSWEIYPEMGTANDKSDF